MNRAPRPHLIFITGTDTGVGKTVVTALLLSHLRQSGCHALALKPFCSGGRADAEVLHTFQQRDLKLNQINPFYFPEPLAPLVAARKHRRRITLTDALSHIRRTAASLPNPLIRQSLSPCLLIEGAGGLLTPLGEGFNLLDLISALSGTTGRASSIQYPVSSIQTILVAPNRLGTINHTILTLRSLQAAAVQRVSILLTRAFHPRHSTPDTPSNPGILAELLAPTRVFELPFLGRNPLCSHALEKNRKKIKKTLASVLDSLKFQVVASGNAGKREKSL